VVQLVCIIQLFHNCLVVKPAETSAVQLHRTDLLDSCQQLCTWIWTRLVSSAAWSSWKYY